MTKKEVVIGEQYLAKVSGKKVAVKIIGISSRGGWQATNTATGRPCYIRTAARLTELKRAVTL